jgi:hypothetical protein
VPVLSFVSAKGSPGVTTTAAALAAAAIGGGYRAAWVELDPAGGSGWVQARGTGQRSQPTLGELARVMREGQVGGDWLRFAIESPPGVPAILAPPGRPAATTVIAQGAGRWADTLAQAGILVMVDGGRWDGDPEAAAVTGADVVVLVCRSTLESVEHALRLVGQLEAAVRCPVVAIVVGAKPYGGAAVASALGVPLAGVMEWRRRDVAAFWTNGGTRTVLVRSAGRVLAGLLPALPSSRQSRPRPRATAPVAPLAQLRRRS